MFLNATQNDTAHACHGHHKGCHLGIRWGVIPIFNMAFMVVNIILNGVVLVHFIKYPPLRTPFTIYLMNLLISNPAMCFIQSPIKVIANLYSNWTMLNSTTCTLNLYGGVVIGGGIMTSHVLITASRIWAITWPISYREKHTKKVAMLAVVAMWCYVHMLKLPQLILDGIYYRLPLSRGCILNHRELSGLNQAGNILIYNSSFVFILVAYPFLWWKSRYIGTVGNSLPLRSRIIRGADKSTAANTEPRTGKASDLPVQRSTENSVRLRNARRQPMLLLTLLTCAVAIFWGPTIVYHVALGWLKIEDPGQIAQKATNILFSLEPAVDPILFALALADLRKSLADMMGPCATMCRKAFF